MQRGWNAGAQTESGVRGLGGWPGGEEDRRGTKVNVRKADGLGGVHVAKPRMKETYCGRAVDEEEWVTTSKEANCAACARAGAPMPEEGRTR